MHEPANRTQSKLLFSFRTASFTKTHISAPLGEKVSFSMFSVAMHTSKKLATNLSGRKIKMCACVCLLYSSDKFYARTAFYF